MARVRDAPAEGFLTAASAADPSSASAIRAETMSAAAINARSGTWAYRCCHARNGVAEQTGDCQFGKTHLGGGSANECRNTCTVTPSRPPFAHRRASTRGRPTKWPSPKTAGIMYGDP